MKTYTEAQLTSFGNYMLNQDKRKRKTWAKSGVTISDVANWEEKETSMKPLSELSDNEADCEALFRSVFDVEFKEHPEIAKIVSTYTHIDECLARWVQIYGKYDNGVKLSLLVYFEGTIIAYHDNKMTSFKPFELVQKLHELGYEPTES